MKKCFRIVIIKPTVQAIWSKFALPLIQVTRCGQVFKIHFLHRFICQLSLHFTTLNKTVTWKLLVGTISQGLPEWTWQSRCYNFWWEIFHCAIILQSHGKKSSCNNWVLVIIKCTLRLLILITKRWEPRVHSALMFFLKFKLVRATASAYQLYEIDHYHS